MRNLPTLLIDVREPYRGALRRAAAEQGREAIDIHGDISSPSENLRPSLAVVQANGLATDVLERVRSLSKTFGDTPCVVLASRLQPALAFSLASLGVAALVELPASEQDVARRCLGHAAAGPGDEARKLVGESSSIQRLRRKIITAAASAATVLVTGETGTGKGLVARLIHRLSRRCHHPFVHVDCSALSPSLIESELFGHERGAFTGAVACRPGRFERAAGGTILLDEIGDLDLPLQSKFLRVLEDREYERLGGTTTKRMTARVIAATNKDLSARVSEGSFRPDLYYRLRVVQLHVPPLRHRICDIPLLVEAGLARSSRRLEIPLPRVSPGFCDLLSEHAWAGNVRELFNVLEAALVQNRTPQLEAEHLEGLIPASPPARNSGRRGDNPPRDAERQTPALTTRAQQERDELLRLLRSTGGNVARVARRMGMPRSTVRYKIRRYDLTRHIPKD